MTGIRRHPITGEPILFAPERADRPNAFGGHEEDLCPFCPGNEDQTPPALATAGDPWRVRVFPNKFPAVPGHEVIVESAEHGDLFETLADPAEVVRMWLQRYAAHRDAACVSLFKNEGERAGASLEHIHSQLMPLPFLPPRVQTQAEAFRRARACPLCQVIGSNGDQDLVTFENDSFVALSPSGSQHSYEQWVVPRTHRPEITAMTEAESASLASILQDTSRAARAISPAQNLIAMNFRHQASAHFYLQVIPRLTPVAGFELGSGTFIDIVDPVAAARRLRQAIG